MTHDPGNEPTISPDGHWRWDGVNWVPNENVRPPETSPNPPAMKAMGNGTKVLIGIGAILGAIVVAGGVSAVIDEPTGGADSEPIAEQPAPAQDPAASGPMTVECRPTGDPKSKIQLKEATLSSDGRDLTFTWTTNEDPPPTVGYFATVTDAGADGDGPAYIVGVEFLEGEPPSYFVDGSEAGTTELPVSQEAPSKSFTASFPLSTMPGIEDTFQWDATFALDGPDISYCPRDGEPVDYTLPVAAEPAAEEPAAASGMELVEAKVAEVSARNGDDREPGTVTKAGTDLTIVIPMADNLTNNFILGGFQNDAKAILQVVQDSGIQVKNTTVTGTMPLQDKRGNELGERPVSRMTFDDVNDLVLENIIKIEEAADDYWVHPALQ